MQLPAYELVLCHFPFCRGGFMLVRVLTVLMLVVPFAACSDLQTFEPDGHGLRSMTATSEQVKVEYLSIEGHFAELADSIPGFAGL